MRQLYLLVCLAITACHPVLAKNVNGQYNDSQYKDWFAAQDAPEGGWCCDGADGHRYDGNYTFNKDGSVTLNGTPDIIIPAGRVLNGSYKVWPDGSVTGGPNPTGHAVLWYTGDTILSTASNIYCFSPGQLG